MLSLLPLVAWIAFTLHVSVHVRIILTRDRYATRISIKKYACDVGYVSVHSIDKRGSQFATIKILIMREWKKRKSMMRPRLNKTETMKLVKSRCNNWCAKGFGLSFQICFENKELKRILNDSMTEKYEEKSNLSLKHNTFQTKI